MINCYDGKHDKETLKKWAKRKIIICPVCGKPYEYCHGKVIPPYFRHNKSDECLCGYGEPETEEHIKGKIALYEWVKSINGVSDVVLEAWLPNTKQRPDIAFKYQGKQCVIEYQCTPIASEYIERHELYKAAGICDFWILGTDKYWYKRENDKEFKQKFIERQTNIYYDSEYDIVLFAVRGQFYNGNFEIICREYKDRGFREDLKNNYISRGIDCCFPFSNKGSWILGDKWYSHSYIVGLKSISLNVINRQIEVFGMAKKTSHEKSEYEKMREKKFVGGVYYG